MNKHGRPTNDRKDCTLKLRLNDVMRNWVENRAQLEGISIAAYVRKLIERDMWK